MLILTYFYFLQAFYLLNQFKLLIVTLHNSFQQNEISPAELLKNINKVWLKNTKI